MATIQHSIEVNVPITRLYIQLTQFEDYPRFLEKVESVKQISKTQLHWTVRTADRPLEWNAEVTEQEENRHIVWHNAHDGTESGRIEMEELGPNLCRITFTLNAVPGQAEGITGETSEEKISEQLGRDLAKMKEFLETSGSHMGAPPTEAVNVDVNELDAQTQADLMNQARQSPTRPTAASISGSPTEVLEDEPNESIPDMQGLRNGSASARFTNKHAGKQTP